MEEEKINEEINEENINEEEQEDTTSFDNLDTETFTYTVDNNNIGSSYHNNNLNKSYLYIIIGIAILVGIIILLIVIVNGSKKSSYAEIENKMVSAAKKYYNNNTALLPSTDGGYVTVDVETLIQNSYLKPFSELTKDDITCTGYVEVYKLNNDYAYFPTLNCGDNYKSSKLADKIKEEGTVESGDGLYIINNEYVFRGEFPNNYVSFNDKNWRIIKINSDNTIKMVLADRDVERNVWDDRYNSSTKSNSGINDFRVSRVLEYLENAYKENTLISKKNKNLLVKGSWCIGKLSEEDTPISNLNLCSDIYDDLYIGLLQVDEVLNASIDENCININNGECTNYNYFLYIPSTWTLNANINKSNKAFTANAGYVNSRDTSNPNYVRPVINLNNNVLYKKGSGTQEDPYVIGN